MDMPIEMRYREVPLCIRTSWAAKFNPWRKLLEISDFEHMVYCITIITKQAVSTSPLAIRRSCLRDHPELIKTPVQTLINSVRMADIIVSATGCYGTLSERLLYDYGVDLSEKVLVDVGINRDADGKLRGDLDPALCEQAYAYTPVPGGVGPMTVAMLMKNVIEYYEGMCRDVKA